MSANEKREEVVQKLKSKQDQMLKNNGFTADCSNDIQKYISDYKMLEIRMTVMQEEYNEAIYQLEDLKQKLKIKEDNMQTLQIEKDDCLQRMRKVEKELELIESYERQELQNIERLKDEDIK